MGPGGGSRGRRHLEDSLGIAGVEAEVEARAVGQGIAGYELIEGPRHFAADGTSPFIQKLPFHHRRPEGGLAQTAVRRSLDAVLYGTAQAPFGLGQGGDVGDAVGRVVERIALGGDPRHFRRFGAQNFVITERRHVMLTGEAAGQHGEQTGGFIKGQRTPGVKRGEQTHALGRHRVARAIKHPVDRLLEVAGKALGMQFADEELGNLLRVLAVGIGAPGHGDPVQGIDRGDGVAEWLQDAREGGVAHGQAPGPGPFHGPERAMVEGDLAALCQNRVDIVAPGWDPVEKVVEEDHGQRLGEDHGGGILAGLIEERRVHVDAGDEPPGARLTDARREQPDEYAGGVIGHVGRRHQATSPVSGRPRAPAPRP